MATVEATAQRLSGLSERTSRGSALLRTRVDIRNEAQNQDLLRSLARGQRLQVRLQETVEGLSVAAISYYLIGLVLYGVKAVRAAGIDLDPDIAAGVAVPLVVGAVWWTIKRTRRLLLAEDGEA
jgi:uncharacterized membrane-anchored protein